MRLLLPLWLAPDAKSGIVTVNLAFSLALKHHPIQDRRLRVGLLDLDIFGPSIPKLMGLEKAGEPRTTDRMSPSSFLHTPLIHDSNPEGAILPLTNHGVPCMSMGFLLPRSSPDAQSNADTAVVWRGLMVQKAVQQLLFDVDWSNEATGKGLDFLVVDMPPGTGDVPLTLGQLVIVDGTFNSTHRRT